MAPYAPGGTGVQAVRVPLNRAAWGNAAAGLALERPLSFLRLRMSLAALFAFIWGALIGLFMAVWHFMGKKSGMALGLAHGVFTVSGIVFLTVGFLTQEETSGWWLLVLFLVTAAGGAYLLSRQVRDKPWPGFVIIAHGGLALASIVLLGIFLATYEPGADAGQDGSVPAASTENPTVPVDSLTQ